VTNNKIENIVNKEAYFALLEATKNKILSTRVSVAKSACREQMELYFWIGEHIAKAQQVHGWGKRVVEKLSQDLKNCFQSSTAGFSVQNLWYMRKFYLEYVNFPLLQQVVGEIPWGQNILIMSKVKEMDERRYYLESTRDLGWTRSVLEHQISSDAYNRHKIDGKTNNFDKTLPSSLAEQAAKAMKNVYMLDTLGLTQPVLEAQLENQMIDKIKDVMLELGYGFSFIGNQFRIISPGGTESFIDLLFFNRRLKCLVAIELKVGKFKPEYAGKMNYYLNLLDDLVKEPWENPTIGIILCSSKNQLDVEYALRGLDKPVGVSEFRLTRSLPKELAGLLPDVETLQAEILKEFDLVPETME
jgi:predicted nuclease of restriction endonuclease-like (RecB) superfamily